MANVQINLTVKDDGSVVLGKIGDKLDDVGKKAKQTQSVLDDFAKSLLSGVGIGAGFAVAEVAAGALLSVVKAIPATFAAWTGAALDAADKLSNLSATTGLTAEQLQLLERVGAPAGVSMETMARSVLNLQRRLELTPKAFQQFGLDVEHLKGLEPAQMFEEVAKAIGDIKDPGEQAAASFKLLGDKSGEMLRVIRDGIGTVEDFGEMTSQQVSDLDNLGDATGEAKKAFENLTMQIAATIAQSPEILAAVKDIASGIGGMAATVRENGPEILGLFSKIVAGVKVAVPQIEQLHQALIYMASDPKIKTPTFDPSKIVPPSMGVGGPTGDALVMLAKDLEDAEKKAGEAAKKAAAEAEAAAQKQIAAMSKGMGAFFDELGKRRTAMESLGGLLGPSVSDATIEMGRLWAATEKFGGVSQLSDAQLVKLVNDMRALALQGGENEAGFEALAAAMGEVDNRGVNVAAALGFVTEAAQRSAAHVKTLAEKIVDLQKTMTGIVDVADAIGDAFQQMGISADHGIGMAVSGVQDLAHAGRDAVDSFSKFASGDIFGGITSGIKALAGVVSGFKKIWNSVFGDKEIMHVNDLRDAFLDTQGGWLALQQALAKVSTEDVVKEIFDAKTVDEFNAAVQKAKDLLAGVNTSLPAPTAPPFGGDYGQTDTGRPPYADDMPHYASGTNFVPRTGPAIVHRGEMIVPARKNPSRGGSGSLGGAMMHVEVHAPISIPFSTNESNQQLADLLKAQLTALVEDRVASAVSALDRT